MNVVVNGLMTSYQKAGKGKVVVFLPGWADTSTTFSKLVEFLDDKYTCLALDLPGFGDTQAPLQAWGLTDYADFIENWLEKIGQKNVYAIVGHSYGGSVAIMSVGNVKPKKMVLLASAGIRRKRSARKTLLKGLAKAGKVPLRLLPPVTQKNLRQRIYRYIGSDMMLLPHMELTYKKIIDEDVRTFARSIKVPTLLIYGSHDKDTPPEYGRILHHAIDGSQLELLEGLGHFLHQENPQAVAQSIKVFLSDE